MQTATILYIILAMLLSVLVAFFQYYYKVKNKIKVTFLLFILKSLSLFLLILLLINPTIEKTVLENEKPILSLLIDNSKSIRFFKENQTVESSRYNLKNNNNLQDKFTINQFTFGKTLQVLDTVSFTENETNITTAITSVNKLYKDKIAPIVLITDGNQTIGDDYEFINSKQPIYPIVIGDTTKYVDVKIAQLNVNKYSYIQNKFPVEVILNYEGNKTVNTNFSIFYKGKTVFRKNVSFSSDKKSAIVTTNLTSTKEGLNYYTASVDKIKNEKNIKNNTRNFSVEVINQQTKILVLSSVLHPDIGALKKTIESNKQRSVDVALIDKFKGNLKDYQLVILYQPNGKFNSIFNQIKEKSSNYLLISGVNTDWSFINKQQLGFAKNAINQSEDYLATLNDNFLTFLQEDIRFSTFPPLKDKFGEVLLDKKHQILLHQNINGLKTNQPLLAVFDENNQKSAVLFGEGIWKWRASSFLHTTSFKEFDNFTGNLVQYLASTKKRNRLEVNADHIYTANSPIDISAFYTDKNYQFDPRAALEITIKNSENKVIEKIPFSLFNNSYHVTIENLISGDYTYNVKVLNENINKKGRFKIADYQIEEQFTNANINKLQKLATNTKGKIFFKNEIKELSKLLLENKSFYTVQKSSIKKQNLIDWKWLLLVVIALFTVEWFVRKYYGKI